MTSVATTPCPESTRPPASSGQTPDETQAEQRLLLALSVLDHRAATRRRYEGTERAEFIAGAIQEARMALDGATIEQILVRRAAGGIHAEIPF
jgi:hypothetical protein